MTVTAGRTYSPFAPTPDDPDYIPPPEETPPDAAAAATSAEPDPAAAAAPVPVDPVVEPVEPVTPPTVAADSVDSPTTASVPESAENGDCAVRTTHLEDTPPETKPEVNGGEGSSETPYCAPKSAPADPGAESAETVADGSKAGSAEADPGFAEAAKASAASIGEKLKPLLLGLRPPAIWTEPPASLKALVLYADEAPWADRAGFIRGSGRVWNRVIALPLCTVLYYAAWLVQRPSRFVLLFVLYVLVSQTSLGGWLPWFW